MFGSNKTKLSIEGMSCEKCVARVKKALEAVDGVESADVNLKKASATVKFTGDKVDSNTLIKAVVDAGYKAELA